MLKQFRYIFILCSILLTACGQSFIVETSLDVPQPVPSPLPLKMAVLYEPQLREYTYTENNEDRINWSIKIGPSQVQLFDLILPAMFTSIDHIEQSSNTEGQGYDAIIIPEIKDIQFALPFETKSTLHETWIKYAIHIQQTNGIEITTMHVIGYGKSSNKTSIKFMLNEKEGLLYATNQAFRDLAAKIIVTFQSNSDIQKWLVSKSIH
jgi:hypothetical protein